MKQFLLKLKIWQDTKGQDLIEYALMAGFVAVAAGAIMPGCLHKASARFSRRLPARWATPPARVPNSRRPRKQSIQKSNKL